MIDLSHLAWPFFGDSHREFAVTLDRWACKNLYREIRPLRIYEGATEVQKVVIARELMKSRVVAPAHKQVRA